MINDELLTYIKKEYFKGNTLEEIKENLLNNNWSIEDIDNSFDLLLKKGFLLPQKEKNSKVNFKINNPYFSFLKKKNKFILYFLIVFLFFLIIFFYSYYLGYFTNAKKIIKNTQIALQEANSFKTKGNLILDWSEVDSNSIINNLTKDLSFSQNFNLNFDGFLNFFQENQINFDFNLNAFLGSNTFSSNLKLIDKNLYLQLKELPELSFFEPIFFLKNNYIYFPLNSFVLDEEKNYFLNLNQTQKKELNQIFENSSFFKIEKKIGIKKINNINSYLFLFSLNKEGVENYLENVYEYFKKNNLENEILLYAKNNYKDLLNNLSTFNGEFYINSKNYLPVKISFDIKLINLNNSDLNNLKLKKTIYFSDWNLKFENQIPDNSINFEDFFIF